MGGTAVIRAKLITASVIELVIALFLLRLSQDVEMQLWRRILAGVFAMPFILVALLTVWMSTMRISYGHTLVSAYFQVIILAVTVYTRYSKVRRIRNSWRNPMRAQEAFLEDIIKKNGKTVYGKDFGIESVHSLKELKKKHLLTTYERYRPYVERMAKGEQDIMLAEPVIRFCLTSGTTGKSKMIPYGKYYFPKVYGPTLALAVDVLITEFGLSSFLQREIRLYTAPKLRYTEGGTVMGPATLISSWMKPMLVIYSTPGVGFNISDPKESIYVHLLFGLRDRNLRSFNGTFTSNIMSAMRMLEQCWPNIVRDIEKGTVTTKNVSLEIHRVLVKAMGGGDPERAAELKREFEKGFEGILKRVWPHMERVQGIDSLGIKDVLLQSYAKGLPLFAQLLGATEGMIGYNISPRSQGKDQFVLLPTLSVMEFIPEDKMYEDQPDTLFIDELQVGGVYEVVITASFGLYRLRYGDVIRVTGFHLNTRIVEFMYRSGQILNVHAEKLDQATVKNAIDRAVGHWTNFRLREYAVAESTLLDQLVTPGSDHRPYYIVFLELEQTLDDETLRKIPLNTVDEELCHHSFTYKSFREKGSIAPPRVHIVKSGSFDRLHDFILENSTTTANQYKVPRKLRTKEMLKFMLDSSIVSSTRRELIDQSKN